MGYVNGTGFSDFSKLATGGTADELFLKVFSGEVLTAFNDTNVMMPLHQVRTIASGKSAQFPAIGKTTAVYHTPGESIVETGTGSGSPQGSKYLSSINAGEKIITINDMLLSAVFISNLQEAKNHYDVRSEYTKQMGAALARSADQTLIQLLFQGAGATVDRFGGNDSTYLSSSTTVATETSTASEIVGAVFDAAQAFDEKNVPATDRFCLLSPENYYKVVQDTTNASILNRDFGNDANGSIASGQVVNIAGVRILKTNNIPGVASGNLGLGDITTPAGDKSSLPDTQDYTETDANTDAKIPEGIVFHRSALGTVKLMDLALESEYQIERQGTLMVARYAMGHDVLRHEAIHKIVND